MSKEKRNEVEILKRRLQEKKTLADLGKDIERLAKEMKEKSGQFFELERIVKSAGLKLADDWGLLFMRPSAEHEDELFLDMQLGMVIILFTTWQLPHGYGFYLKTIEKELAPHDIKMDEIKRVMEKMEKVGLVEKDEKLKGYYVLNRSVFAKRIGKALGFEEEVEERIKEARAKKMREIVRKVKAKK